MANSTYGTIGAGKDVVAADGLHPFGRGRGRLEVELDERLDPNLEAPPKRPAPKGIEREIPEAQAGVHETHVGPLPLKGEKVDIGAATDADGDDLGAFRKDNSAVGAPGLTGSHQDSQREKPVPALQFALDLRLPTCESAPSSPGLQPSAEAPPEPPSTPSHD